MSNTKTEAQRLAALLDHGNDTSQIEREVIDELRRLEAERDQLRAQVERLQATEPFGYFRAEPMGWTDCAATDEGAIALYERPAAPAQEVTLTDEERQQVFKAAENRMVREINLSWRTAVVDEVIAAIRAKGGKL